MTAINEQEILAILKRIEGKQDRMIVSLFGDLDNESNQARLPRLESLYERVENLEAGQTKIWTVGSIFTFLTATVIEGYHAFFKH